MNTSMEESKEAKLGTFVMDLNVLRLGDSQVRGSCVFILRLLRIIVHGFQEIRLLHNPIVTFGMIDIIKKSRKIVMQIRWSQARVQIIE